MKKEKTAKCPHCHQKVVVKDGFFAYHDWPPNCRQICPMSRRAVQASKEYQRCFAYGALIVPAEFYSGAGGTMLTSQKVSVYATCRGYSRPFEMDVDVSRPLTRRELIKHIDRVKESSLKLFDQLRAEDRKVCRALRRQAEREKKGK